MLRYYTYMMQRFFFLIIPKLYHYILSTMVINLQQYLRCLEAISRLKINYHKSAFIGVGVPRLFVDQLATSMGCLCRSCRLNISSYY